MYYTFTIIHVPTEQTFQGKIEYFDEESESAKELLKNTVERFSEAQTNQVFYRFKSESGYVQLPPSVLTDCIISAYICIYGTGEPLKFEL